MTVADTFNPPHDHDHDDKTPLEHAHAHNRQLMALAQKQQKEIEDYKAAIQTALDKFNKISWGWDGCCGSTWVMDELEDVLIKHQ